MLHMLEKIMDDSEKVDIKLQDMIDEVELILQGEQAKMYSIFPDPLDESFGFRKLRQTIGIEETDLKSENLVKKDFIKVASKWQILLQTIFKDESEQIIHSINEIFGFDETAYKAFTVYNILKDNLEPKLNDTSEIEGKKTVLINIFKEILKDK